MKTSFRHLFVSAAVACFFTLTLVVFAQEAPKPPDVVPAPASPAAVVAPEAPAVPAATAPVLPLPPVAPAAAEKTDADATGLRRIDAPAAGEKSPATKRRSDGRARGKARSGDFPLGDHTVSAGSEVGEVVSIAGSTTVDGTVRADAVSVAGDTRVGPEGKVGSAAVAVLGRLAVDGSVGGEAVSVLGGVTINGTVGSEVVSVLGDVVLGPKAVVNGDLVVVGGRLTKEPGAVVRGNEVNVPAFGAKGSIEWLTTWLKQCVLKGRPLAFGPNLGWAWLVAFMVLGFYLLLALLFPRAIERCAQTLETRPGGSILASVLAVLLSPVAFVLLALTVVGVVLLPFLAAGLFFAGVFGKAVMIAWVGRRLTRPLGGAVPSHPFFAVLFGGLLIMLLYTVWGSFLLYKLLSWIGLGVVVYTVALAMKREKRPKPAVAMPSGPVAPVPVVPPASPMVSALVASPAPAATSPGFTGGEAVSPAPAAGPAAVSGFVAAPLPPMAAPAPISPPPPVAATAVPELSAAVLPRAGFFLRLAALAIDGVLIGMIVGFISGILPRFLQFNHGPGGVLLALAIYGAVMWKHKGTTIGGIVCGLRVVRLDEREIDWATAIVRSLGCFLSMFPAGFGFIWVAFDDERQSWHDKIAGTTVVIVPKGQSLI